VPEQGGPVQLGRTIHDFGFDHWDEKSPVLRWTAPENVQVSTGHTIVPGLGDRVLGASDLGPILVAGQREHQNFIALGFDPRQSDLVLRVTWPLFVLNAINHFVEEDTGYISSFQTGELWQIPVSGEGGLAWLRQPDGVRTRVAIRNGKVEHLGLLAGFYELSVDQSSRPVQRFAANLADADESRIAPHPTLQVGNASAGVAEGFETRARHQIWGYLVIAVLLASGVEWITYHRRLTV
jgi:hypothetical protein